MYEMRHLWVNVCDSLHFRFRFFRAKSLFTATLIFTLIRLLFVHGNRGDTYVYFNSFQLFFLKVWHTPYSSVC